MELSRPNEIKQHVDTFSEAQITYLKSVLKNLNLENVEVSEDVITESPLCIQQLPTLGFTGLYDIPIAILASSQEKDTEQPVANIVVIAPTENDSGLLIDQNTGRFLANSFWINEQGILKYVTLDQPIYLDGLNNMYGQNPEVKKQEENLDLTLDRLIGDKQKTRNLLASHNISIPQGIFIDAQDSIEIRETKLNAFINDNPNLKGLVNKGLTGAHGDNVMLFNMDEQDHLWSLMDIQSMEQEPSIIEERIIPAQLPELLKYLPEDQQTTGIDYNFRVLVTLDSNNEQVIDSEIRLRGNDNYPVNITLNKTFNSVQSTQASLVEGVINSDIINDIYTIAIEASKVIAQNTGNTDDTSCRYLGVDIMIGENGKPYIIEINDGAVGGFGTLARIQKSPIKSIEQRYIPYIATKLENSFRQRPEMLSDELIELPHSTLDHKILLNMYIGAEDYTVAYDLFISSLQSKFDLLPFLDYLIYLSVESQKFDFAKAYFEQALANNPDHHYIVQAKNRLNSLMNSDQSALAEPIMV